MACGHYEPNKELRVTRIKELLCPVCPDQTMTPHSQVLPHGFCPCCGECWTLLRNDDSPKAVIHA